MGSPLNQDCTHICVDNISWLFSSRFPATSLMSAATVLVIDAWSEDPLQRALFGEAEVACLCKQVVFTGTPAAEIVLTSQWPAGQRNDDHAA